MIQKDVLKNDERAIFALRSIYKSYGYLPFKMRKFEEYDLYVGNKEFLVSDRVITFNDTDGRLLALKPDVTLSIVKNTAGECGVKEKVYYNENVYRVSGSTGQFKEIMQMGLECIGDIDITDRYEVVLLALKSLDAVSRDFVLDISHMGILSAILSEASDSDSFKKEATELIANRNSHELASLTAKYALPKEASDAVISLASMYGSMNGVLERLAHICKGEKARDAYAELSALADLISKTPYADKVRFDFSIVSNMKYYNGIVFSGFLSGICEAALVGGEYGNLLKRLGKSGDAIGFAMYLDLLSELDNEDDGYDGDVLLLYSDNTDPKNIIEKREQLISEGHSVAAHKTAPKKLRYKRIIDMKEEC
ncbi:MAG: ATP phosphoribosyltransferase regulatory subunit [Clostridia bacterium]|nr:ATP phosphoribosyltransferase regulatory subunit [Clostridia bacterium]